MSKNIAESLTKVERAELAAQVKSVRQRLGLTQQQLADEAGVTRQSIGNIESGSTAPQSKTLLPVLQALGMKPKRAQFSPDTSQWLAIIGGIMDSLPEARRPAAGQAAVNAVTNELVASSNVGTASENVDLHTLDLSQGNVALAATHDTTSVTDQSHPNYEEESQDPEA